MITIYHNPRCRKSRETLALIEAAGVEPEIILYLDNPPTETELREIAIMLDMSPAQFTRTKEAEFKERGKKVGEYSEDELFALLAETPKLIERPIVVKDKKAVLGRPPENVKALL